MRLLHIPALLLLAGCATTPSDPQEHLKVFIGQPIAAMTVAYGPADQVMGKPEWGRQAYIWRSKAVIRDPQFTAVTPNVGAGAVAVASGGAARVESCEITASVDGSGTILGVTQGGLDC